MIDSVIARLVAEVPDLKTVAHAYSMEPLEDVASESPAVFVYPGEEGADSSKRDLRVVQRLSSQVVLFLVAPIAEIDGVKAAVRAALLGWQSDTDVSPLELVRGKPHEIKGGYIWWQDVYVSERHLRQK